MYFSYLPFPTFTYHIKAERGNLFVFQAMLDKTPYGALFKNMIHVTRVRLETSPIIDSAGMCHPHIKLILNAAI